MVRTIYIAYAFVWGILLGVAGVGGAWESIGVPIQISPAGPAPFRFSDNAYDPVIAAILLLSGLAALKRRWNVLVLTTCFLIATMFLEQVVDVWLIHGWRGLMPDSLYGIAGVIFILFPVAGLLLGASKLRAQNRASRSSNPQGLTRANIVLGNRLAAVGIAAYLLRSADIASTAQGREAFARLAGTAADARASLELVMDGIVGLGAAVALAIGLIASLNGNRWIIYPVLAITAGLTVRGFLSFIDFAAGLGAAPQLAYAFQDAVAFVACSTAVFLSARRKRIAPRLTTA